MVCIKVSVFVYVCVPVTVIIKGKKNMIWEALEKLEGEMRMM